MTGVEILASTEIAKDFLYNWDIFWKTYSFTILLFFVIGIITGICIFVDWTDLLLSIVMSGLIGIIVGAIVGALLGAAFANPSSCISEYKVILSDNVLMSEFTDKYEIINQEGRIYTVREKDWSEE